MRFAPRAAPLGAGLACLVPVCGSSEEDGEDMAYVER